MNTVYLNAREIPDRQALHRIIAAQLGFPAHYGHNLDALYDMLTERGEQVRVTVVGQEALENQLGPYFFRFIRVMEDAKALMTTRREPDRTLEEGRQQLMELQMKLSALSHAVGILYFDGATTAPRGTAENRAETMAFLSREIYDLSTGAASTELLEWLEMRQGELTERERRMVYLLMKDVRRMAKIPREEYVDLQRTLTQADEVWRQAKQKSDFAMFEPWLEKIFDAYRRIAGYCAPEKAPYDYWLGEFEEGVDMAFCDRFFETLRQRIVPLLRRVQSARQLDNSILKGHFPAAEQEKLAYELMELIGLDRDHVALSFTEHPFTTSLGSHLDERITTHIYEEDFSYSMFSVIHEGGHALYDTGSAPELVRTVLDCGVSMGIHESQSRFYENLMGRSRSFCETVFPLVKRHFPEQLRGYTEEDLYRAVNRAEPSLIRTEADELTYCLHVMIRYEIEKRLFDGTLTVHELPETWNRLYREYLGIEVPDDRRGVLQDSHWANGNIGYFPSYALGNAYGAQLLHKMREEVDVDACIRRGDFGPINDWNREHIWKYGASYGPDEIFRRAAGEDFDPHYYTDYLEEKFTALYNLPPQTQG